MYFLVSSLSLFYYSIDHFLCMGLSCFLCIIILLFYWPLSLYETFLFPIYHYSVILLATFSVWNLLVSSLLLFYHSIDHFLCMELGKCSLLRKMNTFVSRRRHTASLSYQRTHVAKAVPQVERREGSVNSTAIMGNLDPVSEFCRLEVSVLPFFGLPLC